MTGESNYTDLLLRWLAVKRDTPGLEGEEPQMECENRKKKGRCIGCEFLRERIIKDFERTS